MSFTMGVKPEAMGVRLDTDADFITTLATADGSDWPATVSAELRFSGTTIVWTATRSGSELTWAVDKADVNTLLGSRPKTASLFYIDGDTDIEWARGPVFSS